MIKPRVVGLLLLTSLTAAFVAGLNVPPLTSVAFLGLVVFLAGGGAAILNNYLDRDVDAYMRRTSRRLLPAGQVFSQGLIPWFGGAMVAASLFLALRLNMYVSLYLFLGVFTYVVIYTLWLKRRSPLNIVVGGLAGSCAALAGGAVAGSPLGLTSLLFALLVFLWTPAHFWSLAVACAADYRQAKIPMLPVVVGERATAWLVLLHMLLTVGVSLAFYWVLDSSLAYLAAALGMGMAFLGVGVPLVQRPGWREGWLTFKLSGVYLGGVYLALLMDALF